MSNGDAIRPERRRFLELVVVSAGGALASAACGGGGGDGECDCDPASGWGAEIFELSVASGDPRPTSVVLWTRALDEQRPGEDLEIELEVATEPQFIDLVSLAGGASLKLTARADADGCVKVRLTDLEPETDYYYRFRHRLGDRVAESAVGRTRTAPADDDDLPVRFAVMSCQDPDKGFYHAYTHLLGKGLDFIAHLGDYVYESSGSGVARSLEDYRELYRTVRRRLAHAHARFPFLVIPDDHEFSDDSHGATATYFNGEQDETDLERRRNSDQAWFEYMPVDYADAPTKALDPGAEFPDDFTIYRRFSFGRHLELVLTDLRRYRPDHLIAESAFPGAMLLTNDEVEEEGVTELAVPYIDVETFAEGAYQLALTQAAETLGFRAASVTGSLSAGWINQQLERIGGAELPEPIDLEDPELLRGLAVHQLLKSQEFSRVGSRYFVELDAFEAYAAHRFRTSDGASERVMGDQQRAWFLETMKKSTRTFKVWGSEIAFLPKHLDLRGFVLAPPELQRRIGLTAEDWDGFPNERRELLLELSAIDNVVILSGDLHCFFAATPFIAGDPSRRVVEFTIGSVTSTTWKEAIQELVVADPSLPPSVANLAPLVGAFLTSKDPPANPHLAFQELGKNGYAVVTVSGDALEAELFMIDPSDVATSYESHQLSALFTSTSFRVPAGSSALERSGAAGYERWDTDQLAWQAP
jgi:alkaline phosphatase D